MADLNSSIPLFSSIEEYNRKIEIPVPRYPHFDLRDFEDNMKTVKLKMSPFRIPFFQVALLESGGGEVKSDGEAYDLDQFSLFFNLPGQIIYWDVPQDWRGFYCCLEEAFYTVPVEGFPTLYDLPFFKSRTPAIQLQKEEASLVLDLFRRMHQEYSQPSPYNQAIIKSYVSAVLTYCVRFYDRQVRDQQEHDRTASIGERFKKQVHQSIAALVSDLNQEAPSISDYAAALFITPKHLSETVKKELGVTPTAYVNHHLMQEAQKLLRSTDLQIKEIAFQLGFQDVSYFNRLFKKLTERTPAQYRKAL